MPRDAKRHQKSLQRKSVKRKEKRKHSEPTGDSSIRREIKAASLWPLHECMISENWNVEGELVQAVIARLGPDGEVAFASFLIDLCCMGVKDAVVSHLPREEYEGGFRDTELSRLPMIAADTHLVAKVLREAVAYGQSLGFKPPREYYDAVLMLGDQADPDACTETVPLGKDGRPFYVAGPYENPWAIIGQLERSVGAGNFAYFAPQTEPDDLPSEDDFPSDEPLRPMRVDISAVEAALDDMSANEYFLDLESGAVVMLDAEVLDQLDRIYDEVYDEEGQTTRPFADVLASRALPAELTTAIEEANALSLQVLDRYAPLSTGRMVVEAGVDLANMREFADAVDDKGLQKSLHRALTKPDAASAFLEELNRDDEARQRWLTFHAARRHDLALQAVRLNGIEPVNEVR